MPIVDPDGRFSEPVGVLSAVGGDGGARDRSSGCLYIESSLVCLVRFHYASTYPSLVFWLFRHSFLCCHGHRAVLFLYHLVV